MTTIRIDDQRWWPDAEGCQGRSYVRRLSFAQWRQVTDPSFDLFALRLPCDAGEGFVRVPLLPNPECIGE